MKVTEITEFHLDEFTALQDATKALLTTWAAATGCYGGGVFDKQELSGLVVLNETLLERMHAFYERLDMDAKEAKAGKDGTK